MRLDYSLVLAVTISTGTGCGPKTGAGDDSDSGTSGETDSDGATSGQTTDPSESGSSSGGTTGVGATTGTTGVGATTGSTGVGGSTGSSGGSTGGTTGGVLTNCQGVEGIPGMDSAVSMLVGDLPFPTGGFGSDTNLYIHLSNQELTCQDPMGAVGCEDTVMKWFVTMILPPAMQSPGEYTFEDLGVFYNQDDGVCVMTSGGGGQPTGTVYIDQIGPGGVVGCIDTGDLFGFDPNGLFSTQGC
jgi:hypothetical protein